MQRSLFLIFSIVFVGYACTFNLSEGVEGNGNVFSKERNIHPFHGISVENGIDVFITQTNKEKLLLSADENLHEIIITEVQNGILKIGSKENIKRAATLKIDLEYINLDYIQISSAGDVKGNNKLSTEDIEIRLSSAGDLDLELDAIKINCKISSSGDASLAGTTKYFDAELSSAGDLNAFNLIAEDCKVRVSSAGNARVYGTKTFDLAASSAGDIRYKGEGKIENLSTSSAGTIKKQD